MPLSEFTNFEPARDAGEHRASARIRVSGWATVTQTASPAYKARLFDLSTEGVSLFLDEQLSLRQTYHLALGGYRNGRMVALQVQALCLHATLVGNSGFKHGFYFQEFRQGNPADIEEFVG